MTIHDVAASAGRRAMAVFVLAMAACAPPPAPGDGPPPTRAFAPAGDAVAALDAVLAPYEAAPAPRFLARLDLAQDRHYVVLAQVPTADPIDLSGPEAARRSLGRAVIDPFGRLRSQAKIGHLMIGWHCAGVSGIVSKSGDRVGTGVRMALSGWGLTPFLSSFSDGFLVGADEIPAGYATQLRTGRGSVLAFEVSAQDCTDLRLALVDYIRHPDQPAGNYGMLLDTPGFQGDGCLTFALWLAGRAGLPREVRDALTRSVEVPAEVIGWRAEVPEGVRPYRPPGWSPDAPERRVSLARLRFGDWQAEGIADRVEIIDGELLFAAVTHLRSLGGLRADWRTRRALGADDPAVRRAQTAMERWARSFPVWRLADAGAVSALVLERR
ncbi:hypothetical protein C2I36_00150 [Rhodobacteraceae bacterium WD3A24]|nr:hypothetical protein C2I36_00150 [Rhodobacteraceae bacterium WD3A24]